MASNFRVQLQAPWRVYLSPTSYMDFGSYRDAFEFAQSQATSDVTPRVTVMSVSVVDVVHPVQKVKPRKEGDPS